MATNEERMMILGMVENGKISAEEGTRLLKALGSDEATTIQPAATTSSARYLRIRVTDRVTGQQKVSVNVPLSVVSFGLRFIPDHVGLKAGGRLHGNQGKQLHHMVLKHIPQNPGLLIISGPVLHSQRLGRTDIDIVDILPVPDRLKDGIGKPKHHNVLHSLFGKVMVNAVYLAFRKPLLQDPVQFH